MLDGDGIEWGSIENRGAKFNWCARGSGAPAVVLGSAHYYERAFPHALFRHVLRTHIVDQRNFAEEIAGAAPTDVDLDTYAADTDALLDGLGIREKVLLFGHSIHGLLALEYARRRPERVSGLVIIAAPGKGMFATMMAAEEAFQSRATPERKAAHEEIFERLGGRTLDMSNPDYLLKMNLVNGARYWGNPHFDALALWQGVKMNAMLSMQLFGMLFGNWSITQDPRRIKVPSLVVVGADDFVAPPELWNDNLDAFDHVKKVVFEHSGHSPMLEESVHFAATVLSWWKASLA